MPSAPFKHCFEAAAQALHTPGRRAAAWGIAALLLWCPGVGGLLKQSMLLHMGVQLSLLVAVGLGLGRALLALQPALQPWTHRYRWAGLWLAACTLMVWMLPRLLDLAVENPLVDVLKAASLVLCAGLPLAWCWPELPAVGRGVLHVEALASVWRLGWLYLDSPARLCLQYGLDDQQRLGQCLMFAGALYALWLSHLALGGRPASASQVHSGEQTLQAPQG